MKNKIENFKSLSLMALCYFVALPAVINSAEPADSDELLFTRLNSEDNATHLAGYADVSYFSTQGTSDDLISATIAPILHYQRKEWLFFEAEGEFDYERDDSSERGAALEYATINFILNDNMALGVGRYLSPVGQFMQNLHPSWINKLPTAPIGFSGGHDGIGAAPNADFGVQLRGGYETGKNSRINYAVFAGNGPDLVVEETENGELVIEGLQFPAKISDSGGEKTAGFRLGFLPLPYFEVGVSFDGGNAELAGIKPPDEHEEETEDDHGEEEDDDHDADSITRVVRDRSYRVIAFDFYYAPPQLKDLKFRGEFVSTKLGDGELDEFDRESKEWQAWYIQGVYAMANDKIESVIRYGYYDFPESPSGDRWDFGMNYLFNSHSIAKVAYEFNGDDSLDRLVFQYAYGF